MLQLNHSTFEHLDADVREKLLELLELQRLTASYQVELLRMRIETIRNPTAENIKNLENYSETHIKPLRERILPLRHDLIKAAVNTESLRDMLPMVAMALTQSIDLPLVMTTMGLDPDMVTAALSQLQDFFSQGM